MRRREFEPCFFLGHNNCCRSTHKYAREAAAAPRAKYAGFLPRPKQAISVRDLVGNTDGLRTQTVQRSTDLQVDSERLDGSAGSELTKCCLELDTWTETLTKRSRAAF